MKRTALPARKNLRKMMVGSGGPSGPSVSERPDSENLPLLAIFPVTDADDLDTRNIYPAFRPLVLLYSLNIMKALSLTRCSIMFPSQIWQPRVSLLRSRERDNVR